MASTGQSHAHRNPKAMTIRHIFQCCPMSRRILTLILLCTPAAVNAQRPQSQPQRRTPSGEMGRSMYDRVLDILLPVTFTSAYSKPLPLAVRVRPSFAPEYEFLIAQGRGPEGLIE